MAVRTGLNTGLGAMVRDLIYPPESASPRDPFVQVQTFNCYPLCMVLVSLPELYGRGPHTYVLDPKLFKAGAQLCRLWRED